MDAPWTVRVELLADGQVEVRHGTVHSRAEAHGVCPSEAHLFGVTSWSEDGVVGTVSSAAAQVDLVLSDRSRHPCDLHAIEGTDARYYAERFPGDVRLHEAVAFSTDGTQLGRHLFNRLPR